MSRNEVIRVILFYYVFVSMCKHLCGCTFRFTSHMINRMDNKVKFKHLDFFNGTQVSRYFLGVTVHHEYHICGLFVKKEA